MDKKDKKILYMLDLNSRIFLNKISKKLKVSKQNTDYRIKQLLNKKIIAMFYPILNFTKLGYVQYKVYFKFQNLTNQKEKEIIDYLKSFPNIIWIASCRGQYNLTFSALIKNVKELSDIIDLFSNKYSKNIFGKDILITTKSSVYTKLYLLDESDKLFIKEKKEFNYSSDIGNYVLDNIEQKILSFLSTHARASISEISEKTNISRDIVQYRIKKLEKEKILLDYRVFLNLDKINFRFYKILLSLQKFSKDKEEQFNLFVKQHRNGVQILKLLGNWDLELEFEVEDEEKIYEILQELKNKFSDIIKDYEILLIHKTHKFDISPF